MPDETQTNTANGEKLGKWLALGASIIGIFVTLNTLLSSCADQRIEKGKVYRAQVADEETYWSGLYQKFLEVVAADKPESVQRRHKLTALAFLVGREPSNFAEFESWLGNGPDVGKTRDRFTRIRDVLLTALIDPNSSNRETAGLIAIQLDRILPPSRSDDPESAASAPPTISPVEQSVRNAALAAQMTVPNVVTNPEQQYGNRILTAGAPNGWDVDIFWCSGAGWNHTPALAVAERLADAAAQGTKMGAGIKLGRIRLRSVAETEVRSAILYDDSPGEKEAASAIVKFVGSGSWNQLADTPGSGAATKWYLSIFVCQRAAQPASQPR